MAMKSQFARPKQVLDFVRYGVTPSGFGSFFLNGFFPLAFIVVFLYLGSATIDFGSSKNPRAVVSAAAAALGRATDVPVTIDMLASGYFLGEKFDAYAKSLLARGIGTSVPAPPLTAPDILSHVIISNYPPDGTLYVGYIPRDAIEAGKGRVKADFMLSGKIADVPGYVVPFSMSSDSAVTYRQISVMFDAFVRGNADRFPQLTVSALMHETRAMMAWPARNLPWPLMASLMLMILVGTFMVRLFAMNVFVYIAEVHQALLPLRHEQLRHREAGFVLSPPSWWQCFWSASLRDYAERYLTACSLEIRNIRRLRQAQRRDHRRAQDLTARTVAFDTLVTELLAQCTVTEATPPQVRDDVEMMRDITLTLDQRRLAYDRARDWFVPKEAVKFTAESPTVSAPSEHLPDEEALFDRVTEYDTTDWSAGKVAEFNAQLRRYDDLWSTATPAARIGCLQEAQRIAKAARAEVGARRTAEAKRPEMQRLTLEGVTTTFNVAAWLPSRISHDHVVTILIWGLIKPGRGTMMYVGRRAVQLEQLRGAVSSKLGTTFQSEAFDTSLHWLVQNGVVIETRKKGRYSYSLNYDEKTTDAGREIVQYTKQFVFSVREDLTRV